MATSDLLIFNDQDEDQPGAQAPAEASPWNILIVDDDRDVRDATRILLRDRVVHGRPLRLLGAASAAEAKALLEAESDIALALVDVVMESNSAGLDLLQVIRSHPQHRHMRVVLRTGQPGHAPEETVVLDYDIDGYAAKSELTSMKLFTIVVSGLRAYHALRALAELNRDLETRVAQRTAELERLAMIDALTGLPNRRHFDARAEMEIQAARRDGRSLFVLCLDLDRFKAVNDTYGHAAGDAVLKAVGQALTRCLRPLDFCCRFGGEEFVLLLAGLCAAEAETVAGRLRDAVSGVAIAVRDDDWATVTASVGVARVANGDTGIAAALDRADRAMYRAKQDGRDRVVVDGTAA